VRLSPRHSRSALFVAAAAVLSLAAACGSSSKAGGDTSSTTAPPTSQSAAESGGSTAPGTATSSGGAGSGTFDLYAIEPQSGPLAAYGKAGEQALTAATEVINAQGGIGGRQIKLTIEDDGGDPTKATSVMQARLAQGAKPDLAFTGPTSSESVPVAPLLTAAKVLGVSSASASSLNDPAKFPYFFSLTPTGDSTAAAMVAEMKKRGYTKIGAMSGNDEHSAQWLASVKKDGEAAGLTVTTAQLDSTAVDATPQLLQLQSADPQAVVFAMNGGANGVVLKGRTKLGWDIPFFSEIAGTSFNIAAQTSQDDWNDVYLQAQPFLVVGDPSTKLPGFTDFMTALKKQTPTITQGLAIYANTYQLIFLIKAGVEKAGSTDPAAVAKAIETFSKASDVPGVLVTGSLFDGTSHYPAFPPEDFVYIKIGPFQDGMVAASS
jgi:branched-chain amino acid transport system substrate-binding protein